jgi:hypothetical protein
MWLYTERGKLKPINELREKFRKAITAKSAKKAKKKALS